MFFFYCYYYAFCVAVVLMTTLGIVVPSLVSASAKGPCVAGKLDVTGAGLGAVTFTGSLDDCTIRIFSASLSTINFNQPFARSSVIVEDVDCESSALDCIQFTAGATDVKSILIQRVSKKITNGATTGHVSLVTHSASMSAASGATYTVRDCTYDCALLDRATDVLADFVYLDVTNKISGWAQILLDSNTFVFQGRSSSQSAKVSMVHFVKRVEHCGEITVRNCTLKSAYTKSSALNQVAMSYFAAPIDNVTSIDFENSWMNVSDMYSAADWAKLVHMLAEQAVSGVGRISFLNSTTGGKLVTPTGDRSALANLRVDSTTQDVDLIRIENISVLEFDSPATTKVHAFWLIGAVSNISSIEVRDFDCGGTDNECMSFDSSVLDMGNITIERVVKTLKQTGFSGGAEVIHHQGDVTGRRKWASTSSNSNPSVYTMRDCGFIVDMVRADQEARAYIIHFASAFRDFHLVLFEGNWIHAKMIRATSASRNAEIYGFWFQNQISGMAQIIMRRTRISGVLSGPNFANAWLMRAMGTISDVDEMLVDNATIDVSLTAGAAHVNYVAVWFDGTGGLSAVKDLVIKDVVMTGSAAAATGIGVMVLRSAQTLSDIARITFNNTVINITAEATGDAVTMRTFHLNDGRGLSGVENVSFVGCQVLSSKVVSNKDVGIGIARLPTALGSTLHFVEFVDTVVNISSITASAATNVDVQTGIFEAEVDSLAIGMSFRGCSTHAALVDNVPAVINIQTARFLKSVSRFDLLEFRGTTTSTGEAVSSSTSAVRLSTATFEEATATPCLTGIEQLLVFDGCVVKVHEFLKSSAGAIEASVVHFFSSVVDVQSMLLIANTHLSVIMKPSSETRLSVHTLMFGYSSPHELRNVSTVSFSNVSIAVITIPNSNSAVRVSHFAARKLVGVANISIDGAYVQLGDVYDHGGGSSIISPLQAPSSSLVATVFSAAYPVSDLTSLRVSNVSVVGSVRTASNRIRVVWFAEETNTTASMSITFENIFFNISAVALQLSTDMGVVSFAKDVNVGVPDSAASSGGEIVVRNATIVVPLCEAPSGTCTLYGACKFNAQAPRATKLEFRETTLDVHRVEASALTLMTVYFSTAPLLQRIGKISLVDTIITSSSSSVWLATGSIGVYQARFPVAVETVDTLEFRNTIVSVASNVTSETSSVGIYTVYFVQALRNCDTLVLENVTIGVARIHQEQRQETKLLLTAPDSISVLHVYFSQVVRNISLLEFNGASINCVEISSTTAHIYFFTAYFENAIEDIALLRFNDVLMASSSLTAKSRAYSKVARFGLSVSNVDAVRFENIDMRNITIKVNTDFVEVAVAHFFNPLFNCAVGLFVTNVTIEAVSVTAQNLVSLLVVNFHNANAHILDVAKIVFDAAVIDNVSLVSESEHVSVSVLSFSSFLNSTQTLSMNNSGIFRASIDAFGAAEAIALRLGDMDISSEGGISNVSEIISCNVTLDVDTVVARGGSFLMIAVYFAQPELLLGSAEGGAGAAATPHKMLRRFQNTSVSTAASSCAATSITVVSSNAFISVVYFQKQLLASTSIEVDGAVMNMSSAVSTSASLGIYLLRLEVALSSHEMETISVRGASIVIAPALPPFCSSSSSSTTSSPLLESKSTWVEIMIARFAYLVAHVHQVEFHDTAVIIIVGGTNMTAAGSSSVITAKTSVALYVLYTGGGVAHAKLLSFRRNRIMTMVRQDDHDDDGAVVDSQHNNKIAISAQTSYIEVCLVRVRSALHHIDTLEFLGPSVLHLSLSSAASFIMVIGVYIQTYVDSVLNEIVFEEIQLNLASESHDYVTYSAVQFAQLVTNISSSGIVFRGLHLHAHNITTTSSTCWCAAMHLVIFKMGLQGGSVLVEEGQQQEQTVVSMEHSQFTGSVVHVNKIIDSTLLQFAGAVASTNVVVKHSRMHFFGAGDGSGGGGGELVSNSSAIAFYAVQFVSSFSNASFFLLGNVSMVFDVPLSAFTSVHLKAAYFSGAVSNITSLSFVGGTGVHVSKAVNSTNNALRMSVCYFLKAVLDVSLVIFEDVHLAVGGNNNTAVVDSSSSSSSSEINCYGYVHLIVVRLSMSLANVDRFVVNRSNIVIGSVITSQTSSLFIATVRFTMGAENISLIAVESASVHQLASSPSLAAPTAALHAAATASVYCLQSLQDVINVAGGGISVSNSRISNLDIQATAFDVIISLISIAAKLTNVRSVALVGENSGFDNIRCDAGRVVSMRVATFDGTISNLSSFLFHSVLVQNIAVSIRANGDGLFGAIVYGVMFRGSIAFFSGPNNNTTTTASSPSSSSSWLLSFANIVFRNISAEGAAPVAVIGSIFLQPLILPAAQEVVVEVEPHNGDETLTLNWTDAVFSDINLNSSRVNLEVCRFYTSAAVVVLRSGGSLSSSSRQNVSLVLRNITLSRSVLTTIVSSSAWLATSIQVAILTSSVSPASDWNVTSVLVDNARITDNVSVNNNNNNNNNGNENNNVSVSIVNLHGHSHNNNENDQKAMLRLNSITLQYSLLSVYSPTTFVGNVSLLRVSSLPPSFTFIGNALAIVGAASTSLPPSSSPSLGDVFGATGISVEVSASRVEDAVIHNNSFSFASIPATTASPFCNPSNCNLIRFAANARASGNWTLTENTISRAASLLGAEEDNDDPASQVLIDHQQQQSGGGGGTGCSFLLRHNRLVEQGGMILSRLSSSPPFLSANPGLDLRHNNWTLDCNYWRNSQERLFLDQVGSSGTVRRICPITNTTSRTVLIVSRSQSDSLSDDGENRTHTASFSDPANTLTQHPTKTVQHDSTSQTVSPPPKSKTLSLSLVAVVNNITIGVADPLLVPPALVPKMEDATAVLVLTTNIVSAISVSAYGTMATMQAVLAVSSGCGSPLEELDWATSPTGFTLGSDEYKFWKGAQLGNSFIMCGLIFLAAVPLAIFARCTDRELRAETISSITEKVGTVWLILMGPLNVGAWCTLVYAGGTGLAINLPFGLAMAFIPVFFPVYVCYRASVELELVQLESNADDDDGGGDVDNNNDADDDDLAVALLDLDLDDGDSHQQQRPPRPPLRPVGKSGSAVMRCLRKIDNFIFAPYKNVDWPENSALVDRHGYIFAHSSSVIFTALEFISNGLISLVVGVMQRPDASLEFCQLSSIAILVLHVPPLLVILVQRPMINRIDALCFTFLWIGNFAVALLVVLAFFEIADNLQPVRDVINSLVGVLAGVGSFAQIMHMIRMRCRSNSRSRTAAAGGGSGASDIGDGGGNLLNFQLDLNLMDDDEMMQDILAFGAGLPSSSSEEHPATADDDDDDDLLPDADLFAALDVPSSSPPTNADGGDDDESGLVDEDLWSGVHDDSPSAVPMLAATTTTAKTKDTTYALDDDDDDMLRLHQYLLDDDDGGDGLGDGEGGAEGLGAARNEELERRRAELAAMLKKEAQQSEEEEEEEEGEEE